MTFYVYLHSKPNGEPFYIGKGTKKRAHILRNRANRGHSSIVNKHGSKNIKIDLCECSNEEEAFILESFAISFFRQAGFDLCNATDGGEGPSGHKHSENTRWIISQCSQAQVFTEERCKNISAALKGRVGGMQGKTHSPETKAKMRATHLARPSNGMEGKKHSLKTKLLMSSIQLGKKASSETRKKMSDNHKGKPNNWAGRKHSKESRQLMSLALKGKTHSEATKEKMRLSQIEAWKKRKLT